MNKVYDLLGRLEKVRGKNGKWMACCPAHDDKSPSLSVRLMDDGRISIKCFSGCVGADIMQAIGLTLRDLYPGGKLGHFIPGNTRKHREPEAIYGPLGANNMAEALRAKDREIERLKAAIK